MKTISNIFLSMLLFTMLSNCTENIKPDISKSTILTQLVGQNISVGTSGWAFGSDEPISVDDIEAEHKDSKSMTITADISTEGKRSHIKMGGKIKMEFKKLNSEWILENIENVSFQPITDGTSTLKKSEIDKK